MGRGVSHGDPTLQAKPSTYSQEKSQDMCEGRHWQKTKQLESGMCGAIVS